MFHLHRFEDDENVVLCNGLAGLGHHFDNAARHRGADGVCAARALRFGGGVGDVFEEGVFAVVEEVNRSAGDTRDKLTIRADCVGEAQRHPGWVIIPNDIREFQAVDRAIFYGDCLCSPAFA